MIQINARSVAGEGKKVSAAEKLNLVSVEDYLAGELNSPIKHEYLGGVLHATAGRRNLHNEIATNILVALGVRLHGTKCRPYNSDTKVRIQLSMRVRFYYPDAFVVCRRNPPTDTFQDEPVAIFEVLSAKTRRLDDGEKKDAYLTIPSLNTYVLVEQDFPALIVYRRTEDGFVPELLQGLDAGLPLPDLGIDLPLSAIYGGLELVPEAREGEPE